MTAELDLDDLEQTDTGIGQPYDTAMRRWVERNLPTVAVWLDPAVAGLPPTAFIQRPATFAVPSIVADLLITAGKSRLMHVEYETSPRKGLVARMFNYRARIMSLYPKTRLTQHVIVLENGRVRGHDDVRNGFLLDLRIMYVRERDPTEFLADPVLAPLAVLARGRRTRREHSFGAALRLIRDSGHPGSAELFQTAEILALIRLDAITIDRIRKENGMSIQPLVDHYRNTEVGSHLQRIGHDRGHDEGLQEGREEGRQEKQEGMLRSLLRRQFGDRPEASAIVQRLAGWSDSAAMNAILDAPDIQTLLTAEPPA
jgi:hypothetical protein